MMLKSFILFLVILETAEAWSRVPSFLQCKVEAEKYVQCQERGHKQLPENPDITVLMRNAVSCLGDLKCEGIRKYQEFLIEFKMFNYEMMKVLHCASKDSDERVYLACEFSSEEVCDEELKATPECNRFQKASIKKFFKIRHFNWNVLQKASQDVDGLMYFNRKFDANKFD